MDDEVNKLTAPELENYTKKIIRLYFPTAVVSKRRIDPKMVAFAMFIHQQSIGSSGQIRFIEEVWKGTINPAKIATLQMLISLLREPTINAVKSFLTGEVKIIVKDQIRRMYRSTVLMYFNNGLDDFHPYDFLMSTKKK